MKKITDELSGASDAILDSCSGDQIEFTIVADTAQQDEGSSWWVCTFNKSTFLIYNIHT